MEERELNILNAAMGVIAQYGVRRTTMADIAEASGIARQTLYNSFSNKDAVLRGTIELHAHSTLTALDELVANQSSLADTLDIIFEFLAVKPFELLRTTPHGDEILEGINAAAKEKLDETYGQFRESIKQILQQFEQELSANNITPEQMSDTVVISLTSFKKCANDRDHLQSLYETFKMMVLKTTSA